MMRTTALSAFAVLAAAVSLAACNNNNSNTVPIATATCAPGGQVALVNPANGSTVSGASQTTITIATSTSLPTNANWNLYIGTGDITTAVQTANNLVVVSGPPPGSSVPPFANPIYEQVQLVSTLTPATYNVWLNQLASCVPYGPIGSFTTQ